MDREHPDDCRCGGCVGWFLASEYAAVADAQDAAAAKTNDDD